jgi:hypothetical protein
MTIAIMLGLLAVGQAAPAAVPAKLTMQQQFDAANEAAAQDRCSDAVRLYEAIENAPAFRRNATAAAAIQVRKGRCLIATERGDEGEAMVRRGLPALEGKGAEFATDVREARLALGNAAMVEFDYATAATEFRAALGVASGSARIRPLTGLASVLMFDHDGAALRYASEARDLATADPLLTKKDIAVVQTQYARVLLNEGKKKEAYDELKDSLKKQGGLGMKVRLNDIVTRSDLAIAAMLNKDQPAAQNYLAYTGAGRMPNSPFGRAVEMQPPSCGADGLKPDDYAIVEFALVDDGHVAYARPIYTTGDRTIAVAFARAVADWSWKAEDIKAMPALFRYATRIEIRCTNAGSRPSLTAPLEEASAAWLATKGQGDAPWDGRSDAVALPLQRAALDRATSARDTPAALRALAALGSNSVLPDKERAPLIDRAIVLADTAGAPVLVRTLLAIRRVGARSDNARDNRTGLRALLADPATAADPLSAATLRLLIAVPGYRASAPGDAPALLTAVIDTPGLPARHPLKVNAMLQQANALSARGDLSGARAMFDRTGLTEEQCAMIGLTPIMRRAGGGPGDYPMAAVRMGFEGWVQSEFDVAANGTPLRPRTIVAYPPFVFNEAADGVARGSRYSSSFRPEGGVACVANRVPIRFNLP